MPRFSRWISRILQLQHQARWVCDFGSTSTKISKNGTIVWHQPTCVARHRSSKATVAIGTKAYQLLGKNSPTVEVIFPVSSGVLADADAFVQYGKAVFAELQAEVSWAALLGKKVGVVTTLSQLSPAEAASWKQAVHQLGIGGLVLLPQAQAAATALSYGGDTTAACCIVDLGGQVTEVAIVSAGEVISAVRIPKGGVWVTEAVQDTIRLQHQTALSWHTAELLKRELAYVGGEPLKKKQSVRGKDVVTHLGKTIVVSAVELLEPTQAFAEQVVRSVGEAVASIPTELAANCLEQGLYIIGGTAQIEGLADYLREQLKTEVHMPHDPMTVVLRGAHSS